MLILLLAYLKRRRMRKQFSARGGKVVACVRIMADGSVEHFPHRYNDRDYCCICGDPRPGSTPNQKEAL